MSVYDPRITPARPDLAAAHLAGTVTAPRFVEGRAMHLAAEIADLRRAPSQDAAVDSQILRGEAVTLYEAREGWGWVQLTRDAYVGYAPLSALAEGEIAATHRVAVNRTFLYPRPDIKAPVLGAALLGACLRLERIEDGFGATEAGYVIASHLMRLDEYAKDFVAIAEGLIGTPYLWGGKSCLGIDCSGLVQIALAQSGIHAPRDTDLQQQALGTDMALEAADHALRRGDLLFWKGHVGIMRDAATLLHANAYHMLVASEPLAQARARIRAKGGGDVIAIRRL